MTTSAALHGVASLEGLEKAQECLWQIALQALHDVASRDVLRKGEERFVVSKAEGSKRLVWSRQFLRSSATATMHGLAS